MGFVAQTPNVAPSADQPDTREHDQFLPPGSGRYAGVTTSGPGSPKSTTSSGFGAASGAADVEGSGVMGTGGFVFDDLHAIAAHAATTMAIATARVTPRRARAPSAPR